MWSLRLDLALVAAGTPLTSISLGAAPDRSIARSSCDAKSSPAGNTAVAESFGLSNGNASMAARILTGSGICRFARRNARALAPSTVTAKVP
jgi:hypothetical protein